MSRREPPLNEDSLSLAEAALFQSDDPLVDALPSALVPPVTPGRTAAAANSAAWKISETGGHRWEHRAEFRIGGIRSAFKVNDVTERGHVAYTGNGLVRSVVLGNLSVRAGERLILGRRLGGYPPPSAGPVRYGFAAAPSLSAWSGREGAAVELGGWGWHAHAVTVHEAAGASRRLRPMAVWLAAQHAGGTRSFGVAWGRSIPSRTQSDTPESSGTGVFLVNASAGGPRYRLSGEWASVGSGATYYALRCRRRGIASAMFYRAPALGAGTDPVAAVLPEARPRRGGRLEVKQRLSSTVSFVAAASATRSRTRSERRASRFWRMGLLGGRGDATGWSVTVERRVTRRRRFAVDPVELFLPETADTELRVRVALVVREGAETSHRVRFEYLPSPSTRGALLSVATRVSFGALRAEWRVTKYIFPPGARGMIARPGIGSFEFFSAVAGNGSDVAARGRLRLGGGTEILGVCIVPGTGGPRIYLGMCATR